MKQSRISWTGQVKIYIGKCYRIFINERGWKNLISTVIIAIIISWVAGEDLFHTFADTQNGAFSLVCAGIWVGIFNSIQSICRERGIIKREHRTGLRISSYISARMSFETVICLLQALIMVVILYVFRSPPETGIIMPPFLELFITFFLVIFSSDVLGMLVSSNVKNETQAVTVMPFILILQLVMSGIIFTLNDTAAIFANLTISKWGVNAICSIADINAMPDAIIFGDYDKSAFEFTSENLLMIWGILLGFALLYGLLSIVTLKLFIDKDKR